MNLKLFFLLLIVNCIGSHSVAQNRIFKSEGDSKQINLLDNKGVININNKNITIEGRQYEELLLNYKKQLQKRDKTIKRIEDYPDDQSFKEELSALNYDLVKIEHEITSYKTNFYSLYEAFSKIEINSERLQLAKKLFDNGEVEKADTMLKAEDLATDQLRLLNIQEQKEKEIALVKKQLEANANEYYIKAKTARLQEDLPNSFELACQYYESSLKAKKDIIVMYDYCYYLIYYNEDDKAFLYVTEALELCKLYQKSDIKLYNEYIINLLNMLALTYWDKSDYQNAEKTFLEAIEKKKAMPVEDAEELNSSLSMLYTNIGNLKRSSNELKEAENYYIKAIEFRRNLTLKSEKYLPALATSLSYIGRLKMDRKDYLNAEIYFREAFLIRQKVSENLTEVAFSDFRDSIMDYAVLQSEMKNYSNSIRLMIEGIQLSRELALDNPKLFTPSLANNLITLGNTHQDQQDYEKGEISFREAIELFKKLRMYNPTYDSDVALVLYNLGNLQKADKRPENAESSYEESLNIYRKFAEKEPDVYGIKCAMVLNNWGEMKCDAKDYSKAEAFLLESLSLKRQAVKTDSNRYTPYLANTLNSLADLYQKSAAKEKSLSLVKEAIDILLPFTDISYPQDVLRESFKRLKDCNVDVKTYLADNFPNHPELLTLVEEE